MGGGGTRKEGELRDLHAAHLLRIATNYQETLTLGEESGGDKSSVHQRPGKEEAEGGHQVKKGRCRHSV